MAALTQRLTSLVGGKAARQATELALGTAAAQALGMAAYPVLTRLYLPAEMGVFGVYFSFVAIVSVGTSLRFEAASVVAKSRPEGLALMRLSLWLVIPTTLLMGIFLALAIRFGWFGYGSLPLSAVCWAVLALGAGGALTVFRYWLVREMEFRLVAKITAKQVLVRVATQIAAGLAGAGWAGLSVGDLFGRAAGLREAWRQLSSTWRRWPRSGFTRLKVLSYKYREYVRFGFPSAVLDAASANIPIPLIAAHYGIEAAGCLALVLRVLSAPITLIGGSVSEVYHSRLATIHRSGEAGAESLFWRTALRAFALGTPLALLLYFVGRPVTVLAFGSAWTLAGDIVPLLAPLILSQFVVTPLCRTGFVYNGQRVKFFYDLFVLVSSLAVLTAGPKWGWSVQHTVMSLSAVNSAGYGIYFLLMWGMVRKK